MLFKVNFSNAIYVDINILKNQENSQTKFKVFIGRGNNSLLVKSIIKRRFWWEVTHNINDLDINFYWTQNKLEKVHNIQKIAAKK